jgi:hypothetical protein
MAANKTKRTAFDLDVENSELFKDFSERMGTNFSRAMNYLLRIQLSLNPEVKKMLADFCNQQIADLREQMKEMSDFEKQDALQLQRQFQELAYLYSLGLDATQTRGGNTMKKIYLKEGYVLIPSTNDWVLLDNYKNPAECMYAGVVETREPMDGKKKFNAKHYVYCCDYQYGKDYPSDMDEEVYAAICEKDPSFKDVLNAVVVPQYNGKEVVANMTNLEEYKAAPCPGMFHIVEQGDPTYWNNANPDYEPPFGCMIVRK